MSSTIIDVDTVKKEVDCPHCKGKFDLEIQRKKPKVIVEEQERTVTKETETHIHDTPQIDPHEELAKMLPKGVNFGKCSNGSCGKKIKNAKGLTTKYKACPNCKSNTVPKSNDYCPTCGKDSEEWDDSDIELEMEDEG